MRDDRAGSQTTGWQPIETAPRDGRRIRLLIPYDRSVFTEADCTTEGHWDAKALDPYVYKDGRIIFDPDNGEVGCFRFDGDDGSFDIQPSHWSPL